MKIVKRPAHALMPHIPHKVRKHHIQVQPLRSPTVEVGPCKVVAEVIGPRPCPHFKPGNASIQKRLKWLETNSDE